MSVRNVFTTHSGVQLDFASPGSLYESLQEGGVNLPDLAHSLSLINRYNGHTPRAYSVGLHSLAVRRLAAADKHSELVQLLCLLHDAHEAYLGDITSPMKTLLQSFGIPLARIEARIDDIIRRALLSWKVCDKITDILEGPMTLRGGSPHLQLVKQYDGEAYELERNLRAPDGSVITFSSPDRLLTASAICKNYKPTDVAEKFIWMAEKLCADVERKLGGAA